MTISCPSACGGGYQSTAKQSAKMSIGSRVPTDDRPPKMAAITGITKMPAPGTPVLENPISARRKPPRIHGRR